MTKPPHQEGSSKPVQPVVVGSERRSDPAWDVFIAALLAYALRGGPGSAESEAGDG